MRDALKNILNLSAAKTAFPPNTPAFSLDDGNVISREKFFDKIAELALFFRYREEKIFLLFEEEPALFATQFFALLVAGKDIALPPTNAPAFLENLKNTLGAPLVSELISARETHSSNATQKFSFPETLAEREIVLFSSGSTAEPKPIRKKFATFAASAALHAENFSKDFFEKNTPETPLPLFVGSVHCHHMYGLLHRFLLPFALGACIDSALILSPEKLIARQQAFPQICFVTTPSFLEKIVRYREQYSFPKNCFRISSSGSALDKKTALATQEIFGTVPMEIYGSTEAGGIATRRQTAGEAWQVLSDVEISTTADGNARVRSPFCLPPETKLSDVIKMLSPREFLLFGRTDRLVKIAEKRILLPEIEAIFGRSELVEKAHFLTLENTQLAAVFVPSEQGIAILKKDGKLGFVSALKNATAGTLEHGVFPKKIRVVNELPTNAQGKILRGEMLSLFSQNLAEPILENISRHGNAVSADATFLPDAIYFRGHFPEFQILPGVAQLHFAHFFAQKFFHKNVEFSQVKKLKFSAMIFPRETVCLELTDAGTQVSFAFKKGEKLCSAGVFCAATQQEIKPCLSL